jgi:hypothetical protein
LSANKSLPSAYTIQQVLNLLPSYQELRGRLSSLREVGREGGREERREGGRGGGKGKSGHTCEPILHCRRLSPKSLEPLHPPPFPSHALSYRRPSRSQPS